MRETSEEPGPEAGLQNTRQGQSSAEIVSSMTSRRPEILLRGGVE